MTSELLEGLRRFRDADLPRYRARYEQLAKQGQRPQALFITCSDSRVLPNLVTSTGPGELFVVRTVGNIVAPPEADGAEPTLAAVEFAVAVLGVEAIVVCGHSGCGAMKALDEPPDPQAAPHLSGWVEHARAAALSLDEAERLDDDERLRRTAQRNVRLALERIAAHPLVAQRRDAGALDLHGWYYDLATAAVEVLDPALDAFGPGDADT